MIYPLHTTAYARFLTGNARAVHMACGLYRENYHSIQQLIKFYRTSASRRFDHMYEKEKIETSLYHKFANAEVPPSVLWSIIKGYVPTFGVGAAARQELYLILATL